MASSCLCPGVCVPQLPGAGPSAEGRRGTVRARRRGAAEGRRAVVCLALPLRCCAAEAQLRPPRAQLVASWERGGGAGVLERPGFDRTDDVTTLPRTEEGGDRARLNRLLGTGGGNQYRVLLLDHERHTEAQVAKVLPTVVPSVNPDEARRIFQESKELGAGLVTLAIKEHAEFYAHSMAMRGLRSTIQPDGPLM